MQVLKKVNYVTSYVQNISLGLAALISLLCSYIWDEVLTYPRLALMNPWLSKYMIVEFNISHSKSFFAVFNSLT